MKIQVKKFITRTVIYCMLLLLIFVYVGLCGKGLGLSCFFEQNFHVLCPSCGATTAFLRILHFDFLGAIAANPIFALVVYPFIFFLILQDYIVIACNIIKGKGKSGSALTLLEFIFGGKEI